MVAIKVSVEGESEVRDKFGRIIQYVPKALRNAVKRGATVQTQAVRRNLKRKRTGVLAKSIGNKVKEGKGAKVTALVGPRKGFKVRVTRSAGRRLEGVRDTKKGTKRIALRRARGVKEGDVVEATRVAHLVEQGTKERRHKSGKSTGRMPASPFMKPAFEQTKDQVRTIVADGMRAGELARA